jgi:glucose/arabinose dehydrogenase
MTKLPLPPAPLTALAAALLLTALPVHAQQTSQKDPIPGGIAKSDTKIKLQLVGAGFTMPLWADSPRDSTGRVFVIDQPGQVRLIKNGKLVDKPVLDVSARLVDIMTNFDERGLLGIAFHPGFADAGSPGHRKVYTYTSEPYDNDAVNDFPIKHMNEAPNHQSVIAEWKFSTSDPDVIDPATRRELMRFDQPQFNHDGGAIAFGPDGMLYIGTGDGGNAHDMGPGHAPEGNGQSLATPLAKILRIDPMGGQRHSVPDDNPFVGKDGALPAIWAYGLRNPFRMSFDRVTGALITGDVGQNQVEEVDIIEKGGNYGWPIKEGSFFFSRREGHVAEISKQPYTDGKLPQMIDPVAEYDHDEGISVIGGFVYRGEAIAGLKGLYVFGEWKLRSDKGKGRLLTMDMKSGELRELFREDGGEIGAFVTGMGQDDAGELYVLTSESAGPKGKTGKVWKIAKP